MYRSEKTYQHFAIQDENYRDLLEYSRQTPKVVARSKKQIFTYYQGVSKDGLIKFMTPSGTNPGLYWMQTIQMVDFKKQAKKYKDVKKPVEIVRLLINSGNIKVTCNAPDGKDEPSWLFWGHKYKATLQGYNYGAGETRYPVIRNPKLQGGGCKHVRAVMGALPFHITKIAKDLKSTGVFD